MVPTQDESDVAEYRAGLRRGLTSSISVAIALNVLIALFGLGDYEDLFTWPDLSLTDSIQALAVLIVVIAAVAFGEDRSTRQGSVIDLARSRDLRQVAAGAGVLAPTIGLWGAISRVYDEGPRGAVGAALSLGLSLLLAALASIINLREPARLRALERKRAADAHRAFWDRAARWPRGVPTPHEWADPRFRGKWRARMWLDFALQVAVITLALALVGAGVLVARYGVAHFLHVLDQSWRNLIALAFATASLLFATLIPVVLAEGSPSGVRRWIKIICSMLLCLVPLVIGFGTLDPWWWLFGQALALALLIRILVPGVLGKRVAGVSRSWPSALVDHRFTVLFFLRGEAAVPPSDLDDIDDDGDESHGARLRATSLASLQVGSWRVAIERHSGSSQSRV